MKSYFVGTDVNLSLATYDREVAQAMRRGIATGGFSTAAIVSLFLWPAHPVWSFLVGFCVGAPIGGVVSFVREHNSIKSST